MPVLKIEYMHHVRIRIGRDRANFHAHALLVADGNADHRAAIGRRSLDLVRRLEVRIEAAIGVDTRIQHQADVVAMREDAVDELPSRAC